MNKNNRLLEKMIKMIDYYWILLQKNRTRCCKNCFKKVVHKTAEATGELIENQITVQISKAKPVSDGNSRNGEEIVTPPEKGKKC